MEAKRTVKCMGCYLVWDSMAKAKNLKCKKCGSLSILDNYDPTKEPEVVENKTADDCVPGGETQPETVEPENTDDSEESVEQESDLEAAQKEADKAKAAADEAIRVAEEKAAVAKSKEPPVCSRCKGDGLWHSLKTGYRAKTSTEPLVDSSKSCPDCSV